MAAKKSKKAHLEMTPLMMLSTMAFFLMMPIVLGMLNNQARVRSLRAAEQQRVQMQMEKPTPTPEADAMEVMEK